MHEKAHVIKLLESTREAIKNFDVLRLKELSNQTIHAASTEQDTDSILVAIIVYSMGKIIERDSQRNVKECGDFCKLSYSQLGKAMKFLESNKEESYKRSLHEIMESINKLSPNIKKNIEDVFRKARINKASKIYEHGISMEQTAQLLGISMYELASYAGQREDRNVPLFKTISTKDRIKLAMDFFK